MANSYLGLSLFIHFWTYTSSTVSQSVFWLCLWTYIFRCNHVSVEFWFYFGTWVFFRVWLYWNWHIPSDTSTASSRGRGGAPSGAPPPRARVAVEISSVLGFCVWFWTFTFIVLFLFHLGTLSFSTVSQLVLYGVLGLGIFRSIWYRGLVYFIQNLECSTWRLLIFTVFIRTSLYSQPSI